MDPVLPASNRLLDGKLESAGCGEAVPGSGETWSRVTNGRADGIREQVVLPVCQGGQGAMSPDSSSLGGPGRWVGRLGFSWLVMPVP